MKALGRQNRLYRSQRNIEDLLSFIAIRKSIERCCVSFRREIRTVEEP
jgi:hypothetical protein